MSSILISGAISAMLLSLATIALMPKPVKIRVGAK